MFVIVSQSVLKTFLHDPLVEWSKQSKGLCKTQAKLNETGEIVNEKVCMREHCFCLFFIVMPKCHNVIFSDVLT